MQKQCWRWFGDDQTTANLICLLHSLGLQISHLFTPCVWGEPEFVVYAFTVI